MPKFSELATKSPATVQAMREVIGVADDAAAAEAARDAAQQSASDAAGSAAAAATNASEASTSATAAASSASDAAAAAAQLGAWQEITQAEYDALPTPDPATLYVIVG